MAREKGNMSGKSSQMKAGMTLQKDALGKLAAF